MEIVNHSTDENFCKKLGVKMMYRHLFDHFFLVTVQEILRPEAKQNFLNAARRSINLNAEELRNMANRRIESIEQYFLAHIKNDIDVLRKDLGLRSNTEIFDWLRSAFSSAARRISRAPRGVPVAKETVQPEFRFIENPAALLELEMQMTQSQNSNEEQGAKGQLKMMVNKRIPELILENMDNSVKQLYKVMRHNYQDKKELIEKFKDKVKTSSHNLLLKVINCNDLLGTYDVILMSNLKIVQHIAKKYHRRFTVEDARKTTLRNLIQREDDIELEELFEDFKYTWEKRVTTSVLDNHQDVFAFAFQCAQDFNAIDLIKTIIQDGLETPMIKFMLIDRNEDGCDIKEYMLMNSVITTLIKNLHNKLIEFSYELLRIDTDSKVNENISKVKIDHCDKNTLLKTVNLDEIVVENYYFSTKNETKLVFDMDLIENEVARHLIKYKPIKAEDADLTYYAFKNSKGTENMQLLKKLVKQIGPIPLDSGIKNDLKKMTEEDLKATRQFLLEVAGPIYLGVRFEDPEKKLLEAIYDLKISRPPVLRLENSHVSIAQIGPMFDFINESLNPAAPTRSLTSEQEKAIQQIDRETHQKLAEEMREFMDGYDTSLREQMATCIVGGSIDIDNVPKCLLDSLTFGQVGAVEAELVRKLASRQKKPQNTMVRHYEEMDEENM